MSTRFKTVFSPKQNAQLLETSMRLSKLLVPVDFSPESRKALLYAKSFAQQFRASLTLLHVVEPGVSEADFGYGPVTLRSPNQKLLKKAKIRLNALANRLAGAQQGPVAIVRSGVAHIEIVQAAGDLEIDLIVMGTHGGCEGLQHTPIGSITERVIRQAPCPVFVVRKKEHEFVWCKKPRW